MSVHFYRIKQIQLVEQRMAKEAFMNETKKVFKNTSSSAGNYWKMLQASDEVDNIYHFCMKLFETVANNSKDQFLNEDHEAMLSTLMILEFYKNTKLKPEKWLEQTRKINEESKPRRYEHAKWIVKLYLDNSEEHQFALNFVSSIAHIPEKFDWKIEPGQQLDEALTEAADYEDIIEFKRKDKPYKKLSNLAFDEALKQSKIASFSYCCFLDYVRSSNYVIKKKIWLTVLDNLKGLIHALRFSGKGYSLVTVYLHFINQMLKFYGCHSDQVLKQMLYFMNILRNSPGCNAYLAQTVFDTIHGELKCPGNAFRRQLKRRFVNLDYKKGEGIGSRKYLLTSRTVDFKNPQFCTLNNLRKLVIYNMLGSSDHPERGKYWEMVEPLDSDTTYDLYFKMMKIMDISNTLQTYDSIQKLMREGITELFKFPWKPYRKLHKEEEMELTDIINQENPYKYFQFPNFEVMQLTPEQIVDPKGHYSLYQLIEEVKQYPYNYFFYTAYLEFIFYGNDEELLALLQIFCQYLVSLTPQVNKKLLFYLIPTTDGRCSLARYIAGKDLWYKRHVYNVFRKKMIYPYVSPSNPDIKDSFPMYLYVKSLHMYMRQAERKVPIQIFKCDLSMIDSTGKSEAKTIYFVNKVLMGVSIQSSLGRKESKKEKKDFDILDFYLQKSKKTFNMTVDVNVRYKEPGTKNLVSKLQKNMQIEDIQICNTPRYYFFGNKPNPLNQFIEVSILTQSAGKIFKNELQSKQNFKRYNDAEMAQAFKDLFINMTVETIEIIRSESMKDMLKVLIDGVEFNAIDKIKISQAKTDKDLPMTLPIKCFLPFEA